jgi:hypothetical protein
MADDSLWLLSAKTEHFLVRLDEAEAYRSGRSLGWLKMKNANVPAVRRQE